MASDNAMTASTAAGLHLNQGDTHLAWLILKVVIEDDSDGFFAQGLDIDYAAQGDTLEEVKDNFQTGLQATVRHHLNKYGNLNKLLKQQGPPEAWAALNLEGGTPWKCSTVQLLETARQSEDDASPFPYTRVQFLHAHAA